MKALILAAGKGIRMLPHTADKPKVLIEVAGKPFLYYVLKNLKNAGVNDIAIIVPYSFSSSISIKHGFSYEYRSHWKSKNIPYPLQQQLL